MADIWITSDTHFGHANIIQYCNRPFKDIEEMDETIIQNWNSVVKPGDKVYHLGDVYFGDGERFLSNFARLNGKKRLVIGNHDDIKRKIAGKVTLCDLFEKVTMWRTMGDFGLLLTHVPVHPDSLIKGKRNDGSFFDNSLNIHGHIHDRSSPEGNYRCVCVEQTDYIPVNIEELRIR